LPKYKEKRRETGEGKEKQKAVRVGRNVIHSQFVLHWWPRGRRCVSGERGSENKKKAHPMSPPKHGQMELKSRPVSVR